MLDIDDPGEVSAAADGSMAACAAALDQATQAARLLLVHPRECSPFDQDLLTRLDRARGAVTAAAAACGQRSAAADQHAGYVTRALAEAEVEVGYRIANSL